MRDLPFIDKNRIKQNFPFNFRGAARLIYGVSGKTNIQVITGRTGGIEREKRGIDVIEDLHDYFPVWRKKRVTPLKCLVEIVDKHIKMESCC